MARSPTSPQGRRAAMLARLADLQTRLQAIEVELDSHHNPDWEDLATEREGDEVLEASGLSAQAEVRMIRAALNRIDTGDYGHCAKCGSAIGDARLDAVPFTPFCRSCATALAGKGGQ